ncbi:ABC transporter ATP-binding protein [Fundicoccus culcitae]|uniref:ATP-binding cassette domain-containing protein n=1 Tax=Fundicoccus culcitae TaxID=2969821 RepID=A0ABY5P937_9LACT|nr:ATP-binding cassette domain-containing protein [Fundicoccus culcitae]UUX34938.1 ATP-binding cassette domain-containing protein [Fundicoccus culcitae]
MQSVIETHNLSKQYGSVHALNQVNISVDQGDIYGLIGRNGAGKTTLMKIINRQILASEGSFDILGENVTRNDNISLRIGTLIEAPGLYLDLTAYQNIALKCQLAGIRRPGYIEELLHLVNLADTGRKRAKNFSLGMKQRLGLAIALVGDPDILLLDEPTNGMDPQGIAEFRQMILRLNRERHISVVISSHILGELSKFITKLGIIHEGQLIKEARLSDLEHENQDHLTIKAADLKPIVAFLEDQLHITNFTVISPTELHIFEHLQAPESISHPLIKAGILFDTLELDRHSLEDMFLTLTGGAVHA